MQHIQVLPGPEPEPEPEPAEPRYCHADGHTAQGVDDVSDDSASAEGSDVCDFLDELGVVGGSSSDTSDDGDADPGSEPSPAARPTPEAGSAALTGADTVVRLVRLLKKATGRHPRVLDIGCGDGALLLHLHTSEGLPWSHLAGITADEPAHGEWDLRSHLEGADCVHMADFERGSAASSTDQTGQAGSCDFDWRRRFDLVVSLNTFHHLLDPIGAVQSALGLLIPGI
eukprot:COSAG02_NODE_4584_length_5189_cov_110.838900_5_plen_228_part_00